MSVIFITNSISGDKKSGAINMHVIVIISTPNAANGTGLAIECSTNFRHSSLIAVTRYNQNVHGNMLCVSMFYLWLISASIFRSIADIINVTAASSMHYNDRAEAALQPVKTTLFCQLFSISGSAVPHTLWAQCRIILFRVITKSTHAVSDYDLIVLNTKYKVVRFF